MKHKKLYETILSIDNLNDLQAFFKDLATEKELQDFSDRLEVAKLLIDKKTYEQISRETKMSSATIARVNRALVYGDGGYIKGIESLNKDHE